MATKRVMEYECDNCHKKDVSDTEPDPGINRLPKNWVDLRIRTNTEGETNQHLCGDCMTAVKLALLQVRVLDAEA